MTNRAIGTFEVNLVPEPSDQHIGRMSLDKVFKGDLAATSSGQMLSASTEIEGSAGYVALERVSGTLNGRHGIMKRGSQQLSITVVPDSGTGELVGLDGRMHITISDGKHSYAFEYALE